MDAPSDTLALVVVTVVALAAGALGAWVFLRAGLPGGKRAAGLVGGLVAGVLIGEGVVGSVWPGVHDAWIIGGAEARRALDGYDDETETLIVALRETGVTPVAIDEELSNRSRGRDPLTERLREARAARARGFAHAAQALLVLLIGASAPYWMGRHRELDLARGLGVLVGVLLAIAIVGLALRSTTPGLGALTGGVIVSLVAVLTPSPSARTRTGLLAFGVIGVYAGISAVRVLSYTTTPFENVSPGWSLGGAAAILLLLGWPVYHALTRTNQRRSRRLAHDAGLLVLLPGACALAVLRIDPHALGTDWVFWVMAIGFGLVSSDLRWYALSALRRALGRPEAYSDAERVANAGGGVVQAIIAIGAHQAGLIDDHLFAALLIGGAVGEMTVALRARIALAMQRGEPLAEVFGGPDDEP